MTLLNALIVEDDPDCAEAIGEILADSGYRITHAASPGQALEVMGREPAIAVVVLDLHLPEMDGLRLLRELRTVAGERSASVQALLCSGAAASNDLDAAMRDGVSAYLPKPIERAKLLNAMTDAARRYRDLEADRGSRAALLDQFRKLEDGFTNAARQVACLLDLPTPTPSSIEEIASPGVDRAWRTVNVRRLLREARQMDRILSQLGLDGVEWRILLTMAEADLGLGEAAATGVALDSGASTSAGLRRIAALEERGLLMRREDPEDGRRTMLQLTEDGRDLAGRAVTAIMAGRS